MISLIAARARNGVIGVDGQLPWHIPADLAFFKEKTLGKPVIMGRRTYQSIGFPLPRRPNLVITRNSDWNPGRDEVLVVHSLASALEACVDADEVMVIGGAQIYEQALALADRLYLTDVEMAPKGDTLFPELVAEEWSESWSERHPADGDVPAFTFRILDRR